MSLGEQYIGSLALIYVCKSKVQNERFNYARHTYVPMNFSNTIFG